jgi:hypothetical protein
MQEKITQTINKVKESQHIDDESKVAIMEKLNEWKKEDMAISDFSNHFEQYWLDIEPILAELGWI